MKKLALLLSLVLVCLFHIGAFAASYNYVNPDDFKQWLESDKPMIIVDIQDKEAFAKQHFAGSIETNAYPVETDAERKSIDPAVEQFKQSNQDVVVVCPRGGGGAKRCYDYMKSQGVPDEKLFILTGGADKWPFKELFEGKN